MISLTVSWICVSYVTIWQWNKAGQKVRNQENTDSPRVRQSKPDSPSVWQVERRVAQEGSGLRSQAKAEGRTD